MSQTVSLSLADLDQLRRNAKRLARQRGFTHTRALDELAQEKGVSNWSLLAKRVHANTQAQSRGEGQPSAEHSGGRTPAAQTAQTAAPGDGPRLPRSREEEEAPGRVAALGTPHNPVETPPTPFMRATREELHLMLQIVQRFETVLQDTLPPSDLPPRVALMMDLEACHCNGCPLDLQGLLHAPREFDFVHDVGGILRHLDRATGQLGGLFRPRYAARTVRAQ